MRRGYGRRIGLSVVQVSRLLFVNLMIFPGEGGEVDVGTFRHGTTIKVREASSHTMPRRG
ncbi:MAG: hypothetical protein DI549_22030 [Ancylobacter novellus]|uniref:Uncharacterized protein n=1 Tax=Ancylobacter novellus TaxID=921 RepID=A0A2W5SVI5_ANCNO|nr:MAG: hypothetical protein DI549_22030 [Ancylobacter novellus]